MLKEFREFVVRGNVMDLAVAVVMGGAFTAIVKSLVDDVIMPIVGMLIGGIDFSSLAVTVGSASVLYGRFLQSVVGFVIVAWVVFLVVKSANRVQRRVGDGSAEPEAAPAAPTAEQLLTEIRDLLKQDQASS